MQHWPDGSAEGRTDGSTGGSTGGSAEDRTCGSTGGSAEDRTGGSAEERTGGFAEVPVVAAPVTAMWLPRLLTVVALLVAAVVASQVAGSAAAVLMLAGGGLLLQLLRFALPAAAHRAFNRGALPSAARRYRWIARTAWLRHRRLHAELSLAAVALADGEYAQAEAALAAFDGGQLDLSARAAWLNNRAYALLRQSTRLDEAWQLTSQAMALRPDVPGIRHTHGLALLARGHTDAAIAALDELHHMGDLPPALEAERCADLARAWSDKGEADYAAEYRGRAALAKRRGDG
jgi:tetratricopeptide (TPR) repeat protein